MGGSRRVVLLPLLLSLAAAAALRVPLLRPVPAPSRSRHLSCQVSDIVSPFDAGDTNPQLDGAGKIVGPLPLTLDNVELVLDEMRPYLLADGGNVAVREIDGATVILELQGACGSCPSSEMTMKMGLEKGLLEKIPEIVSVEQISAEGEPLTEENVEKVLEDIRPFLKIAGGDVSLVSIDAGHVQPSCTLRVTGKNVAIKSIRGEIIQRLRKEIPTMHGVLWEYDDDDESA
jgi:Fe-S cluster biogenesis protein NfuA